MSDSALSAGATWPRITRWLGPVLLAIGIALVYWPVARFEFLNWDDDQYVVENRHVNTGLSLDNLRWAITSIHISQWHPLTWLSHQFDVSCFGLRPGPAHLENVAWHLLNTLLVGSLWQRLTGHPWRAWLIAALFALHPLRVESVAWIAERKDLLSACSGLAAVHLYLTYCRQPSPLRMLLVAGSQLLSLLAKPMLVTLPVLLLLLDYQPLQRLSRANWQERIREKWPLIVLSGAMCFVAIIAQDSGGTLRHGEQLPRSLQLANAAQSVVVYLRQTVWPEPLAAFYPLNISAASEVAEQRWFLISGVVATALIALLTWLAWRGRSQRPLVLVGWLWFLVALLPVVGIVHVGWQAHADRYTYLPHVGLLATCVYAWPRFTTRRGTVAIGFVGAVVVLAGLSWQTRRQLLTWRNSETLFTHCLSVTGDQPLAHFNLGWHYDRLRRYDDAATHYEAALAQQSDYPRAHNNLGVILRRNGDLNGAIEHFRAALSGEPGNFEALMNLAQALERQRNQLAALEHLRQAVELRPDDLQVELALGRVLANVGNLSAAEARLRHVLAMSPDHAEALLYLGIVQLRQGDATAGRATIERAQQLAPDDAALQQLAREALQP